jgi:hypothetical protein
MVSTVVAPTVALPPGSLTGTYGGPTASVTVGVGVGANVLVGGSSDTISRQPSVSKAASGSASRWLRIDEPEFSTELAQPKSWPGTEACG